MPDETEPMHPFTNFSYAFGAECKLLERAYGFGFLIEAIVLYVTLIHGCLQIALVLDNAVRDEYISCYLKIPSMDARCFNEERHCSHRTPRSECA